ncbi:uncharacterized protein N7483_007359 [Penicillium malachiteum]|uniref:uncharacterized protein n=1 Tax=Penicillium malachiteum TaxID=1324776 RepID=UPI0025490B4A|nr:uncharacterized protein N7483_007359 [Penicillium malachiteum]KAJ5726002.1 hypothetical protein N7483_007359 [Penicillium malachiteum]
MAATYNVQTYLLKRANIQDTIVRTVLNELIPVIYFVPLTDSLQMHLFDTGATAETINSVYTAEIHLDYDELLGFSPEVISSEAWAKRLYQIHTPFEETQHVIQ